MLHKQEKIRTTEKIKIVSFLGGYRESFSFRFHTGAHARTLVRHRRDRFATMWLDAGALSSVHAARSLLTNGDVALTA